MSSSMMKKEPVSISASVCVCVCVCVCVYSTTVKCYEGVVVSTREEKW